MAHIRVEAFQIYRFVVSLKVQRTTMLSDMPLLDILPESSLNRSAVSITDICVEICLNFRFVVSLKVHCTMMRSDMPLRDIRPETSLNRYVAVFMADIWVEAF